MSGPKRHGHSPGLFPMFEKQFGEELDEMLETKQLRALLLIYCSLSVVFCVCRMPILKWLQGAR